MTFDFQAFKTAFERRDVDRLRSFYASDAEWLEYSDASPPSAPRVMRGAEAIHSFLRDIAEAKLEIAIDNEVIGEERAAFTVTVRLGDGRRILENVIVEHRDGRIVRQLDVEAWD